MSTAVAVIHRDEILAKVRSGMILREIAAEYGVTKQALHPYLRDDPEYQEAMIEQAESMVEHAKEETWAAREALDIARAREMAKFAFRYAEAVNPAKWSPKREIMTHDGKAGDWSDRLRRARGRTIEAETQCNNAELVTDNRHNQAQVIDSKEIAAAQRDFT